MARIENVDGFRQWLEGRPEEVAVVLAARSALRVWALWPRLLGRVDARARSAILLPTFRATAAPLVAATGPTRGAEVRSAAADATHATHAADAAANAAADATTHAANAANAAANAAADATTHAANAANAATHAAAPLWAALSADAAAIGDGTPPAALAARPLWPEGPPDWAAGGWATLRRSLNAVRGEHWVAWTRWYQARLDGKSLVPAKEEARVLIPEHLWDEGPAAVNAALLEIEAQHAPSRRKLRSKIREVQTVVLDPEALAFRFRPARAAQSAWYNSACEAVGYRLSRLGPLVHTNQVNAYGLDEILNRLVDALNRYRNRPQELHDVFADAILDLGPVLEMTDHQHVVGLDRALRRGQLDIRVHRREVERVSQLRAEARIRLETERLAAMATVARELEQLSQGDFRGEVEADGATAGALARSKGDGPIEEGEDKRAVYRLAAKLIRVRDALLKRLETGEKVGDKLLKLDRLRDLLNEHWPHISKYLDGWFP